MVGTEVRGDDQVEVRRDVHCRVGLEIPLSSECRHRRQGFRGFPEQHDPLSAGAQQMLGRQPRAVHVVHQHVVERRLGCSLSDEHDGLGRQQPGEVGVLPLGHREHEPVVRVEVRVGERSDLLLHGTPACSITSR